VEADRAEPLLEQVVDDEHERHQRHHREGGDDAARGAVGTPAPSADRLDLEGAHPAIPAAGFLAAREPRSARTTIVRATPLTSSASRNRTRPAAISAARWVGSEAASPNSLAITAASV